VDTPVQTTLTITFDPPITFGEKSASEVTLREPTSEEYDQAMGKPGFGLARHLMVVIGKLPAPIAAKVPVSKMVQADAFFAQFVRAAPEPDQSMPQEPQEGDAEIFASMALREPTIEELERAGGGYRGTAKLVAYVTGIPLQTALRMPVSVAERAADYFAGFVTPSPAIGNS
jgi:hypothetical protein